MADNQDSTGPDDDAKQAEADGKLNAVVKSHLRRELKAMNEQFAALKALITENAAKQTAPAPEEGKARGADGKFSADKADPQLKQLTDQFSMIQRELKEERERRVALEAKAKRESIRAAIKSPLEAAGVKGLRLDALAVLLEQRNLMEVEGAEPSFKVARSRAKGAPVEELEFDIQSGIQDWLKSPEAADFLPAPNTMPQRNPAAPRSGMQQRQPPKYEQPARTTEEMLRRTAEQLAASGIDINEALKGD